MRVVDAALDGLTQAQAMLEGTAYRLARLPLALEQPAPQDCVDLSAEMVNLLEARNLFQINTRVLRTAFEMDEHLLDVLG
ncbi:MAG: hypothetical protein FJW34_07485 [Acidobacteria bacterium]|nr:hypothetical protein [Acidobacteriota bacterium]